MEDDIQRLYPYCTDSQRRKLEALRVYGSQRKAAKALGCSKSTMASTLQAVRHKAAKAGNAPEAGLDHPMPDGFNVRKFSNLYGADGELKLSWVSGEPERDLIEERLRAITDELCEKVESRSLDIDSPNATDDDLLTIYPQPEPHFGMFAWGKETGDDYDCSIAGEILLKHMAQLVASAPKSKYALISSMGDWFHADTPENRTAKSGNQLDVDTRWPRVVKLGVKVFVELISMALQKHEKVFVVGVGGNHDPQTNYMLSLIVDAYYRNNPRVMVDLSPSPFKYHRFGQNLIGINHGDMAKPDQLPLIMAADVPQDFGQTKFRLWLTGHIHHLTRKEYTGGIVVETVRSSAAKDSWHNASGYRSQREMKAIVLHRRKGETLRLTASIQE